LVAIKRELVVIGNEGDAVTERMGNDKMVARVIMFLLHVNLKASILFVMFLMEVENLELTIFFYRAYHVYR
jgi:hypothetical protein